MEFRIVKTKARPDYNYPGKYRNVDWFIVQYRDNHIIRLLNQKFGLFLCLAVHGQVVV